MPLCGVSGLPIWQQGVTCSHIGSKKEADISDVLKAGTEPTSEYASKYLTSTYNVADLFRFVKPWDSSGALLPWNARGKGGMISIKKAHFFIDKRALL